MVSQDVKNWHQFESFVASIYRRLGAKVVKENYCIAGTQIDVYIEEETKSGQLIKVNVECKYYQQKVGVSVIRNSAAIAKFLRDTGEIHKNVLVAYNGFTTEAFQAAKSTQIELLSFYDLEQKLTEISNENILEEIDKEINNIQQPEIFKKSVFVMMPFDEAMDDLYVYGIRGCAEKLGLKCIRVDEIEHNSNIINEIKDRIKKSEYLIGEMSKPNKNVYYEVGYAHGLGKEVILLTNNTEEIPFDLKSENHIVYKNIKELEQSLEKRIKTMMSETSN